MKGKKHDGQPGNSRSKHALGGVPELLPVASTPAKALLDPNRTKRTKHAAGGKAVSGVAAPLRMDRPGRKLGGRVGADKSPLSTAATTSSTGKVTDPSGC